MARKITVTIELDEVAADFLDSWQPYARPSSAFPEPSRADKVMLAVYAAVAPIEALNSFNEDCGDSISRQWGWKPQTLAEHEKRKRRMQPWGRKKRSRAREAGQD